jgi:hypothetical protein
MDLDDERGVSDDQLLVQQGLSSSAAAPPLLEQGREADARPSAT